MKVIDIQHYRAQKAIKDLEKKIELNVLYPVKGSAQLIKQSFCAWVQKQRAVS